MKLIAHKNDYKGLIQYPVILISESELTPIDEMIKQISLDLEPAIIDETDVPDKKYIKSWKLENGVIGIDMVKACSIFKEKIRMARERKFSSLDILFQRALEEGTDTSKIVAQKQILRNLPEDPRIDECKTTQELDLLWKAMGFEPYYDPL